MFAEDEGLLPERIFTSLLAAAKNDVAKAADRIGKLFKAMQERNGEYGNDDIQWFNGGLFKQIAVPTLTAADLEKLRAASADMDWRAIDPTIFGTLFERGLGTKRAALGAHYTDTGTIAKLVEPLVRDPLLLEWQAVREKIAKVAPKFGMVRTLGKKFRANDALQQGQALYQGFLLRLADFRVLDPACGSGNFLYLALKALRDVEKRSQIEAQELGLQAEVSLQTGPHNILGLEINEFAAELARVTVWIGDIQWCRQNGWPHSLDPILKPLDGIEHRDALMNVDGSEAAWPQAEVIVGNPPFIGDRKMIRELGEHYTAVLRGTYEGRVPGGADLVCYWFEKARAQVAAGHVRAAGLVSTNSIRGGANRIVLKRIVESSRIFLAWSDEPWVNDGAAVRVSMIGFGEGEGTQLNGAPVDTIAADLTAHIDAAATDVTRAVRLAENANVSFIGTQKNGPFDVPGETARAWLKLPNPNGHSNAEVVRPWCNALDITRRPQDRWVIDFGINMLQADATLYEMPFAQVLEQVKPTRLEVRRDWHRTHWWLHGDPRPALRRNLAPIRRFIVTPMVAKHRVFAWLPSVQIPENLCVAIAREDDTTFGILHSRFHEVWALRMGTSLEDRPRYTPTSTFETFPFPEGLTPKDTKAAAPDTPAAKVIAKAAQELDQLRNNWLNPPQWTEWVTTAEEQAAGFPKRPVAKPGHEADLKKRTLTNLYNARPAWLALAHETLDRAVAAAYGWSDYTPQWPDEDILRRLLALNQQRSKL